MIFISKKRFEKEVCSRVEQELCKHYENQHKQDQIREIHQRIGRIEMRLEKAEEMLGIPTNLKSESFVI